LSELEYFPLETIIPVPGVFSLVAKLSVEANKPKLEEHLQAISKATGQEYTFDEGCIEKFYPKLDENEKTRVGSLFLDDAMSYLAKNLEKALKDEMVLEAWNEAASAHQVTIQQAPIKNYWEISLKDGNIVLTFSKVANISSIEYFNIEPLL